MSQQWRTIEVRDYSLTFNIYGKAQFHTCAWCKADALKLVVRTSALSDRTYEDFACEQHARAWQRDADALTRPARA